GIAERCIIQSFDVAILEAVRALEPMIPVALLVENEEGLDANLLRLSFKPDLYSPAFAMANEAMAKALRTKSIGLLVWTVNEVVDMERMLRLDVDGIITDHPERAIALVNSRY
ncbi:MAG: glycerophosphodiester phosphodiesterase family protein, partial [Flavobacteriales bacterium]